MYTAEVYTMSRIKPVKKVESYVIIQLNQAYVNKNLCNIQATRPPKKMFYQYTYVFFHIPHQIHETNI